MGRTGKAAADGKFAITDARNGFSKSYVARGS